MHILFSHQYMRIIIAILGVVMIIAVSVLIAQTLNLISYQPSYATLNVEGIAEVNAVPDIGKFNFTVEAEATDVAKAQELSGKKINDIITYLQSDGGVEEKDIKTTGYNAQPRYEYKREDCSRGFCENKRNLVGYVVTQNVQVKVRNTAKAGELVGGVGGRGATNMSGLFFEVDDVESLKEEARLLAVSDAKNKAKRLAKELEVRLGDIISFNTGNVGEVYPMPYNTHVLSVEPGVNSFAEKSFSPDISVGEDIITAHVTITYQLK